MSKQRMMNTRFWVDPWVQEELNSLDRLLFLYLLTNDQTNLSGIYEVSNHKMCFETGIEKETLLRSMFPRLEPKVYREGNWVIMVNFPKHQNLKNPSIVQGILRELEEVPEHVYQKARELGYPIDKQGGTRGVLGTPNLTKPNLTVADEAPAPVVDVPIGQEENTRVKPDRRTKDKEAVYELFSSKEQPWMRHAQQKKAALSLFDLVGIEKIKRGVEIMKQNASDKYCPQASTPFEYEEKLPLLARYVKKNNL